MDAEQDWSKTREPESVIIYALTAPTSSKVSFREMFRKEFSEDVLISDLN